MDAPANDFIDDLSGKPEIRSDGDAATNHVDAGGDSERVRTTPKIAGFDAADPGDFIDDRTGGDPYAGDAPRKRGRPRGTKNKPREAAQAPQNLAANLEKLLLSVHTMGAAFLSCPELELKEDEAKKIAESVRELSKFYPVVIDAKKMAWAEFAMVMATVYGVRGVQIYKRMSKENDLRAGGPQGPKVVPPKMTQPNPQPEPVRANGPLPMGAVYKSSDGKVMQANGVERRLMPSDVFGPGNGVNDEGDPGDNFS
jgi:hypothetical protein